MKDKNTAQKFALIFIIIVSVILVLPYFSKDDTKEETEKHYIENHDVFKKDIIKRYDPEENVICYVNTHSHSLSCVKRN